MRRIAFVITLLGLFLLLTLLIFSHPIVLTSTEQLQKLPNNQKVVVGGQVMKEFASAASTILALDSGIELVCDCPHNINYKGKNISVLGIVDDFTKKKQIIVLRLSIDK